MDFLKDFTERLLLLCVLCVPLLYREDCEAHCQHILACFELCLQCLWREGLDLLNTFHITMAGCSSGTAVLPNKWKTWNKYPILYSVSPCSFPRLLPRITTARYSCLYSHFISFLYCKACLVISCTEIKLNASSFQLLYVTSKERVVVGLKL